MATTSSSSFKSVDPPSDEILANSERMLGYLRNNLKLSTIVDMDSVRSQLQKRSNAEKFLFVALAIKGPKCIETETYRSTTLSGVLELLSVPTKNSKKAKDITSSSLSVARIMMAYAPVVCEMEVKGEMPFENVHPLAKEQWCQVSAMYAESTWSAEIKASRFVKVMAALDVEVASKRKQSAEDVTRGHKVIFEGKLANGDASRTFIGSAARATGTKVGFEFTLVKAQTKMEQLAGYLAFIEEKGMFKDVVKRAPELRAAGKLFKFEKNLLPLTADALRSLPDPRV